MRKTLLLLLGLALIFTSMIAGCAKESPAQTQASDTTKSQTSAAPDKSGEAGDPITITALKTFHTDTIHPDEMPCFQKLYEDLNVIIEWEEIRTDWDTKKPLLLASGDYPDTFWSNGTITLDDITTYKEIFAPLNEYIDNSVNIKKMFAEEPNLLNMVSFEDGSIYSLPHRMPLRPVSYQGNYINQTWLDTLGLDVPETLDEFTEVLRAFKTQDPNGNGQPDEIPFSWVAGTSTSFGIYWLFGSFGIANNVFTRIAIVDDAPVLLQTTENYKEGIKYLSSLYAEGLIDTEVFTQEWGGWAAKCEQSDPIIMGVTGMWTKTATFGAELADQYSVLPPLKNGDYEVVYPYNDVELKSFPVTWTMTTSCENPEKVFEVIDYIYDPAFSVQLYFGSYGVGIEEQPNGTYELLKSPDPEIVYDVFIWQNSFGDAGPYYVSKEFEEKIIPNDWVKDKYDIDLVYQPYCTQDIYPSLIFSQSDSDEMAVLRTDIENLLDSKMAAWITGEANIDEEWDQYLSDLENLGLTRYMEILTDRYNSAKN